jgi:hypothetical protein
MPVTNTLPTAPDQFISLEPAIEMTARYREKRETILAAVYKGKNILALSETFSKEAVTTLLAVDDCAAVRIYYGMDETDKVHAILVPVNAANEDILPQVSILEDDPVILEQGQRCPPTCPPPSDLNN